MQTGNLNQRSHLSVGYQMIQIIDLDPRLCHFDRSFVGHTLQRGFTVKATLMRGGLFTGESQALVSKALTSPILVLSSCFILVLGNRKLGLHSRYRWVRFNHNLYDRIGASACVQKA